MVIFSENLLSNKPKQIDLSYYPKGLYFLKLLPDRARQGDKSDIIRTRKIIIK